MISADLLDVHCTLVLIFNTFISLITSEFQHHSMLLLVL